MNFLVSKTSKACAANTVHPPPYDFEEITLTKDHFFPISTKVGESLFSIDVYVNILRILFPKIFPKSICAADFLPEYITETIRQDVSIFYVDGWYLCVRNDEVLQK